MKSFVATFIEAHCSKIIFDEDCYLTCAEACSLLLFQIKEQLSFAFLLDISTNVRSEDINSSQLDSDKLFMIMINPNVRW